MITIVIPTIGRPSLRATLAALGREMGPETGREMGPDLDIVVVDDRPYSRDTPEATHAAAHSAARSASTAAGPLPLPPWPREAATARIRVLRSGGRGPAAARNVGWRAARTPWVVFLDDDVVPLPGWAKALRSDLSSLPENVAGSQGVLQVPLPVDRRPTDAERNTDGLARAAWITADMAYRRDVLERVGGFDERFPRAYREDADLALRVIAEGYSLARGRRVTRHPVRDDGFWSSVRAQRGNADDALMRRRYGAGWRAVIGGAPSRLAVHALISGMGLLAIAGAVTARGSAGAGRKVATVAAGVAGAAWLGLTAEFAWVRISAGPGTPNEIVRMLVTSVAIPPLACAHRLRGEWRVRRRPGTVVGGVR